MEDIRKYKVRFRLIDPGKGGLNDPKRVEIIKKVIEKDTRIKEILDITAESLAMEVHAENGTIGYFIMKFPKALLNYDEFHQVSVMRYGKRALFSAEHECLS